MTAKHIMITGAAGDIGEAMISAFARTGASLVLADKNLRKLESAITGLPNVSCVAVQLDVTSAHDWGRIVSAPEVRFAELDAVIMAAGIEGPVDFIEQVEEREFDAVMNANVKGVWFGLKACLPPMKERGRGAIVVVASLAGRMGTPLLAPYSASKHAVLGLVRSTAREAARHGVRINAIAPGPVRSEMMRRIDARLLEADSNRFQGSSNAETAIPMGRYVTPAEVADVAVFLCANASRGCTGGVFPVDGGVATW